MAVVKENYEKNLKSAIQKLPIKIFNTIVKLWNCHHTSNNTNTKIRTVIIFNLIILLKNRPLFKVVVF